MTPRTFSGRLTVKIFKALNDRQEERGKRKEERGLPNCLTNSYPRMYADDTLLTYTDKDVNIIQSCLNED